MAKDTTEVEEVVEEVKSAELGDREEQRQDDAPKDVRGAIKAAFKEVEEKAEKDDKSEEDDTSSRRTDADDKKEIKRDTKGAREQSKVSEDEGEKETKKEEKVEDKTEPPPYYKTKGKAVWDKLTPEDKQLILAREKEVSDGFAQTSSKVRAFEDMEKVISPRLQAIQKFGVSPAQTVDRLFQWMEALSNQDGNARVNSFKQLAANFGIDVAQLVPKPTNTGTDEVTAEAVKPVVDDTKPPAWANQVVGEVTNLKQQFASQQQAAADAQVAQWAKDKPHYGKVNQLMYQLMMSGAVPMKDGNLDLDGAYSAACKLNPEVSALIQQETVAKDKKEADDKAAKDAQLAKARLEKARKAGTGLKPAAPSISATQVKPKTNGVGQATSVRDSLRQSMKELSET